MEERYLLANDKFLLLFLHFPQTIFLSSKIEYPHESKKQ